MQPPVAAINYVFAKAVYAKKVEIGKFCNKKKPVRERFKRLNSLLLPQPAGKKYPCRHYSTDYIMDGVRLAPALPTNRQPPPETILP